MGQKESEEGLTSEVEPEVAEEDIGILKQSLAEEKAKAEGYLANWQRAQADFINYKRRSEQEKEEISKFANASLMFNLLPILDDLERAFTSIPPPSSPTYLGRWYQAYRAQAPSKPGGTRTLPD